MCRPFILSVHPIPTSHMRAALHDRVENLDLYGLSSEVATKNECATSVGFASARRDADADDAPVGGAPLPNPAAEPAAGAGVAIAVSLHQS